MPGKAARKPQIGGYGQPRKPASLLLTECEAWSAEGMKWKTIRDAHGHVKRNVFRCGKCKGCANAWSLKIKGRIYEGMELRKGTRGQFWTLTMDPDTCNAKEPDHILAAWHKLLKSKQWRRMFGRVEFCRVLERHKSGAVHLHVALFPDPKVGLLPPLIKRAKKGGESLASHYARQSEEGQAMLDILVNAGFGQIAEIENIRRNTGRAVGAYLGKYLSKGKREDWKNRTGGPVRVFDTSKGWLHPRPDSDHLWSESYWDDDDQDPPEQTGCSAESKLPVEKAMARREAGAAAIDAGVSIDDIEENDRRVKAQRRLHSRRDKVRKKSIRERPKGELTESEIAELDSIKEGLNYLAYQGFAIIAPYRRAGLHMSLGIMDCISRWLRGNPRQGCSIVEAIA